MYYVRHLYTHVIVIPARYCAYFLHILLCLMILPNYIIHPTIAGNDDALDQERLAGEAQRAARVAEALVLRRPSHVSVLLRGGTC